MAGGVGGEDFGDEGDVLAEGGDGLADESLGAAVAVHFRGVDEGEAELDAAAEGGNFCGAGGGRVAEVPGALADAGDGAVGDAERGPGLRLGGG